MDAPGRRGSIVTELTLGALRAVDGQLGSAERTTACNFDGPRWRAPEAFDDGEALWEAVCEHELAKRLHEPYLPGERGWVKVKNRAYWRWEDEREGAIRSRERAAAAF